MAILFSAVFGAMSIVWDREFGFLKEILVAPIDRSAVAIGKALGGATQAIIQGLILLILAPVIGIQLTVGSVLLLLPFLFVLAFALSALGVALASRMRSMQGFQVVMNFLVMPMFFLSGSLFPLTGLPEWMTVLTRLDPVTYGMDPIRRILLEGAGLPSAVLDRMSLTIGETPSRWWRRPASCWHSGSWSWPSPFGISGSATRRPSGAGLRPWAPVAILRPARGPPRLGRIRLEA